MISQADARAAICTAIAAVAPDVDVETITDDTDLRFDLDLDSMDFLNVVEAVNAATGVDVPERDYGRVETLRTFVDYLVSAETTS